MLKKYLDFINESLELILESEVVYSDKMRTALGKVEHPLAKTLLDIENKDLPVQSNYFDISIGKNDTISFTPERKAQEILADNKEYVRFTGSGGGWLRHTDANNNIFKELDYTPEGDVYQPNSVEAGEIVSSMTSKTSGKVFCYVKFENGKGVYNKEKLAAFDNRNQRLWTKNRQEIKVGRVVRAILQASKIEFVDRDIEQFVNMFKSTIDKFNDKFQYFEEIKGDQIGFWYNSNNYKERRGSLGSSCMSGVPATYFDIYISNPDVCSLVILRDQEVTDKILGRALLWTLSDGKRYMDRIYTINDSDVQLFKDYARENAWYVKSRNASSASPEAIAPSGEVVNLSGQQMTISIKPGEYNKYPYLDTFKFWDRRGTLSIEKSDNTYPLESTGGHYVSCEECNGSGRVTCYDCDGDGSWECGNCDGDGEIGSGDDAKECNRCGGDGRITCDTCDGNGNRDCYECQ
jgi:hypothetical protein